MFFSFRERYIAGRSNQRTEDSEENPYDVYQEAESEREYVDCEETRKDSANMHLELLPIYDNSTEHAEQREIPQREYLEFLSECIVES